MSVMDAGTLSDDMKSAAQALAVQARLAIHTRRVADFITVEEQRTLLDWAVTMEPHLHANGPSRAFRQIDALPHVDPLWDTVRQRVTHAMDVADGAVVEPLIGHYLSIIAGGGAVHRHKDPTPAGTRHLRCNLFLQLPAEGGRPIVLDTPIAIAPRMAFAFYPSEMRHGSERVGGDVPRVLLSFGYTVPADHRLPAEPIVR